MILRHVVGEQPAGDVLVALGPSESRTGGPVGAAVPNEFQRCGGKWALFCCPAGLGFII